MTAQDKAKGSDQIGVTPLNQIFDHATGVKRWYIDKLQFDESVREEAEQALRDGASIEDVSRIYGGYLGREFFQGNLLLNEGINELWTLVAGGSATAFSNANAYLAVGDSTTAESASQTDLQAASNKLYKAMDASYPTYGSSQKITFRSTFGSSDANFSWQEFSVANGSSGTAKNLNRKVSNQGTKVSGQTWVLTLDITLS